MNVRGAEGAGAAGSDSKERRAAGGQRVHFEALVAVGESAGGGFEAESVDVSPEGMRLRTAYLPEIGDKLLCRFDGLGTEVVAEGEVAWRNAESRGGEFGLRFVGLDAATAEAVRAMCAELDAGAAEPSQPEEAPAVARGARVRLHIEGLGSPMKARVREGGSKAIEVGSNLEFLKVGRSLEIEDVDQGVRREAMIEQVKVDVDPATNVPQLVVALRYDREEAVAAAPARPTAKSVRPPAAPASEAAPKTRKAPEGEPSTSRASRSEKKAEVEAKVREEAADAQAEEQSHEEAEGEDKAGMGARAAGAGRAVAGKLGPVLAGMSLKAKSAMAGVMSTIRKRRAERAEVAKANAPRRTTAPAPGGGIKAEGRRLVRGEDSDVEEEEIPSPPLRSNKRAAVIGSGLGLLAVLAVFAATKIGSSRATAQASADASPTATAAAALLPGPGDAALAATGTPTANVPLFGATPLSTTEPVPMAPSPSAVASAAPAGGDGEDSAGAGDDEGAPGEGKSAPALKEWGQGSVNHPVVLKIKMDGPVEKLSGASGAMGFTITVPDRRSLSTASELTRKDKRLASVNVVNTSHGAEVTVQFKDGVPPYLAKAKGDRLEIALGTEGHASKKVAKKKKAEPKTATKKKHK
jgi:hypothetical protein